MSRPVYLTEGAIAVEGIVHTPWWAATPKSYLVSAFVSGLTIALIFKWVESLSSAVRRSNRSLVLDAGKVVSGVLPELLTNLYESVRVLRQRPITGIGNPPAVWNKLAFSRLAKALLVLAITLCLEAGANVLSQPSLADLDAQKFGCIVLDRDPQHGFVPNVKAIRGSFSRQITVNLPQSIAQYTSLPTLSYERTNLSEYIRKEESQWLYINCTAEDDNRNRIRCRVQMLGQLFQYKIRIDISTVDGKDRFFVQANETKLGQEYASDLERQLDNFSARFREGKPVYTYPGNGFEMRATALKLRPYNYSDVWPGDEYMTMLLESLRVRVEDKPKCNYTKRAPGDRDSSTDELQGALGQQQLSFVPVFPLLMLLCAGQLISALIQWLHNSSYFEPPVIAALEQLDALGDSNLLNATGHGSLPLRGFIVPELRRAHIGYARPHGFPVELTEEVSPEVMEERLRAYNMDFSFR